MRGMVDLHCHWVPGIDDGARSIGEGLEMLRALHALGFEMVVATPHMRPGMFDNERPDLVAAFERTRADVARADAVPEVALSSEHYFDDVVFGRLMSGEGLPYPGDHAVLLEFYELGFPAMLEHRLLDLRRRGLLPVIAHPERYQEVWRDPGALERLIDQGATALLDAAAFAGKYGRRPRRAAEELLERGLYHAACSDAHRPSDVAQVAEGLRFIERRYGPEELDFLLRTGPREMLAGRVPR